MAPKPKPTEKAGKYFILIDIVCATPPTRVITYVEIV